MDYLKICSMPVVEMVEAIKTKRLSPVEVMDAVLSRIERLNPKVNAYCTLVADSAREQAKEAETMVMTGEKLGPLHGVPVSVKDNIFTKGIRTTCGSKIYENFIPQQDSVIVERLKAAGAIIVGKTNLPEFGLMGVTDNLVFGETRNPWNLERTPGGSSGGAAASVALCMPPLAIGGDGGGSIRIPASFCGVFGHKPSLGRVPRYPVIQADSFEDVAVSGPIARTVRDAALTLEVIAGRDERDRKTLPDTGLSCLPFLGGDLKGLKVAWSKDLGYAPVDPQVLKITEAAVKTFTTLGCTVEVANPEVRCPRGAFGIIASAAAAVDLQDKLEEWREQLWPNTLRLIEQYKDRLITDYGKAVLEQVEYWDGIWPFFEKYDLLLTPTVAVPPFELGKYEVTEIAGVKGEALDWIPFTWPFNLTGQPAASVPCEWTDDGLPVGLQIVGRRFDDVTVLKAAAAFEQAAPWIDKLPPLD